MGALPDRRPPCMSSVMRRHGWTHKMKTQPCDPLLRLTVVNRSNFCEFHKRSVPLPQLDFGPLSSAGVPRRVLRVILREQPLFVVLLGKEKEDEHGAEQDRDDSSSVGRAIARQKGRLRRGSNLASALRIAVRYVDRAGERLQKLAHGAVG